MTMQSPGTMISRGGEPGAQSLLDELVIAAYDTGVPLLDRALDALDEVLVLAAEAEHAARRPEDPLPVPGWVAQVRDAIARGLTCQGSTPAAAPPAPLRRADIPDLAAALAEAAACRAERAAGHKHCMACAQDPGGYCAEAAADLAAATDYQALAARLGGGR